MRGIGALTRDDVLRVIGALVLDEAEAVHKLDLGDGAVAALVEEIFDFLLASFYRYVSLGRVYGKREKRKQQLAAKERGDARENELSLGRLPRYRRVPEYSFMVMDEHWERRE